MRPLLIASLLYSFVTTAIIADDHNGEELFKEKCTSCHLIYKPKDMSQIKAPPLQMMVWKLGKTFNHDRDKFEAMMDEYYVLRGWDPGSGL